MRILFIMERENGKSQMHTTNSGTQEEKKSYDNSEANASEFLENQKAMFHIDN